MCLTLVQLTQCCDHVGTPETSSHGCLREEESRLILWVGSQLENVIGGSSKKTQSKQSVHQSPRVPAPNLYKLKRHLHFYLVYLWKKVEYNRLIYFLLYCHQWVLSREQCSERMRNRAGKF